jgi:hypothetical protein
MNPLLVKALERLDDIVGTPRFPIGEIEISDGVAKSVREGLLLDLYIDRHWRGDWRGHDEAGIADNESALAEGAGDVMSEFKTPFGDIWILTTIEPDDEPPFCIGTTSVYFRDEN